MRTALAAAPAGPAPKVRRLPQEGTIPPANRRPQQPPLSKTLAGPATPRHSSGYSSGPLSFPPQFPRPMNGPPDTRIRSAPADVPGHLLINIFIGWLWFLSQQHRRAHNLPRLAVSALRHIDLDPRPLQRVIQISRQAFDRRHPFPRHSPHRRNARTNRLAIQVHRASTAQRHPATVFRSGKPELLADHPQKRRLRIHIYLHWFSVQDKRSHASPL